MIDAIEKLFDITFQRPNWTLTISADAPQKTLETIGSELNIIDRRSCLARSNDLVFIGKMIGGWLKSLS